MAQTHQTPARLARAVCSELKKRESVCPRLEVLVTLFETMYYASLKTEESAPISFHLVYLDPNDDTEPDPPGRPTNDNWMFIQLAQPIPVTMPNLIKIANASDPRTSSFAIYHDRHEHLFVWGFVDQGNSYNDYVNYESETGSARPGLFQASIIGVGHLVAYIEMKKIAELNVNVLVTSTSDVLRRGPVLQALMPGINAYLDAVRQAVSEEKYEDSSRWEAMLTSSWLETLCRLLLRVQRFHHGGAILITPENSSLGLNIKYELPYDRLRSALENQGSLRTELAYASNQIWERYIDKDANEIPVDLYLDESISRRNLEENRREIEGTIWFLSLLTRVDGLVLLNQNLDLQGFGVEIVSSDEPPSISMAGNPTATKNKLRSINYNHYGTRHRSMMRYCAQVTGSVGFVVSQDGDVRAMTQVQDHLVMWENIKLQLPDFVRRKKSSQ